MEIRFYEKLPRRDGDIVKEYLKTMEENKLYDAFTINNDLEIVECKGVIRNNGSYNYHNNYDDSDNELYIKSNNNSCKYDSKWFTLNKEEAIKIQQEHLAKWKEILTNENNRLDLL